MTIGSWVNAGSAGLWGRMLILVVRQRKDFACQSQFFYTFGRSSVLCSYGFLYT
jgi:hypothetical protein